MNCLSGGQSGDAAVGLWAVHGAMELRVFTAVEFCAAWNGGGGGAVGCCELRLRSTPRYRLVCNCFPDPGGGLP